MRHKAEKKRENPVIKTLNLTFTLRKSIKRKAQKVWRYREVKSFCLQTAKYIFPDFVCLNMGILLAKQWCLANILSTKTLPKSTKHVEPKQ